MSFQRYLNYLNTYKDELEHRYVEHKSEAVFGQLETNESDLNQLLEDLTDYAQAHGDEHLFNKLLSLQEEKGTDYGFGRDKNYTQVRARVIRIIRVLETFGRTFLESESLENVSEGLLVKSPGTIQANGPNELKKVFVVHGHDNAVLFRVKETLNTLGLKPIVLREQPNGGRTVIEKFEAYSDVGFAVVLMTSDDMGGSLKEVEAGSTSARARQNVVMELGFFASKLSRGRICVLKDSDVEPPSDIMGVVYTEIDRNEAWRLSLAQELGHAGYEIDLNKLLQS